jgi:hypothetical protein
MTRTTCLSTLSCAAILAALTAYGCGSSSTINTGTGGAGGRIVTGAGGGAIIVGTGGQNGGTGGAPGVDGGVNVCTAGSACTAGFMCRATCNVGGNANNPGTRACMCTGNGGTTLNCGAAATCMAVDAGPMPDAGFNMCVANTPCTTGFTCRIACNTGGGVAGTSACTCTGNGGTTLACQNGGANCVPNDAGAQDAPAPVDAPRDTPPG